MRYDGNATDCDVGSNPSGHGINQKQSSHLDGWLLCLLGDCYFVSSGGVVLYPIGLRGVSMGGVLTDRAAIAW